MLKQFRETLSKRTTRHARDGSTSPRAYVLQIPSESGPPVPNPVSGAPKSVSEHPDFSLVLGGPLYQILLRAHMDGPALELLQRRIVAAVLITWLPLALLALVNGSFLRGVSVPFLYDLDVHARFLLSLPLLIAAEVLVHRRLRQIVDQFKDRDLLPPEVEHKFDSIIASAMRLRNSIVIEMVLLAVSFTGGYWVWESAASLHTNTWYSQIDNGTASFTWAGYWYVFFSIPIFRFVLLRWYFRLCIWYLFLFRVSRLDLRLNALHPDRAGGLGFLGHSADAFAPVLMAQTIFLASVIANQIWHAGTSLTDFQFLIGGTVVFLMLIVLFPLAFFSIQMTSAKRAALREYGSFAAAYTADFREKWLGGAWTSRQEELGSGDIQSLADLGNSFAVVEDMGALPFRKELVVRLFVLLILPLLPLGLLIFPFEVLLKQLISLVL
jgi:hypothetical protein